MTMLANPPADLEGRVNAINLDREHFEKTFVPLYDNVLRLAMARTRNSDFANDVAQETFLRAWKSYQRGNYDGRDAKAWLFVIANNVVRTRYKQRMSQQRTVDGYARTLGQEAQSLQDKHEMDSSVILDPSGLSEFESAVIGDAASWLVQVGPKYRRALYLRDVFGEGYGDVGTMLGIPLGTVSSAIYRGRRGVGEVLARHPDYAGFDSGNKN